MKKIYAIFGLTFLVPFFASAHVKWFVDSDDVIRTSHDTLPFYGITNKEVLVWSGIVLLIVFIFSMIDQHTHSPKRLLAFGLKNEKVINRISQAVLGLFLITVSLIWKIILIPEIPVATSVMHVLQVVQIAIGCMFVFNIKPRVASVTLMLFCAGLIFRTGFVSLLENTVLLTLAFYFYIVNSSSDSRVFQLFNKHAVEIVRVGTGISLITLAFTEKFLYPELSMQFLQVHHWNFMQELFPWFSDKLFVLSTGFAETIFGILFIFGYITRVTTVLIAIFFGLSVTVMLAQFRQWEVEDLVVYSAAILFVFYGHGKTKFFHFIRGNTSLQKSVIE
jgi:hypothetical protein